MRFRIAASILCAISLGAAACSSDGGGVGPDPMRAEYFRLQHVDNGTLPLTLFTLPFGGEVRIQSATLVPYAVGRTIDRRLVNDRTGRGGTGGNTRDTTVARGQMMDIRILQEWNSGTIIGTVRDSTLVDVEVRDTAVVITRPHPDPARVRVDTGYFLGDLLVVPTRLDYQVRYGAPIKPAVLTYTIRK